MAPDPLIGTVIAGHQIEAVIGRGGMGSVYLARHLRLGKARALKLLPPDLAEDEDFRGRFEREWRAAAEIEHPSIVEVLDAGEQDGRLYILMRYVDGVDLHKVIDTQGPLELERAVNVLAQVASALDSAHARGLIHRDVKPSNILLGPDDRAYLSDFGIAKSRSTRGLTKTGLFVGTVDYASPEQIESRPLDGRADVYALGGVLYSCVTGAPPYERDTDIQVIFAQLRDPVPKPSSKRPGLPPRLDDVLERAMAKAKEERYSTCGEFVGDAKTVLSELRRDAATRTDLRGATQLDRRGATELDRGGGTVRGGGTLRGDRATAPASSPDPGAAAGDGGLVPLETGGAGGRRPIPRRALRGALAGLVLLVLSAVGAVLLLGGGSDTVDVGGRILDARSSQPLEGVRIAAGSGSSLTSSDGRFSFNAVPRDEAIRFSSCAHAPKEVAAADVDGELAMRLEPLPVRGTVKSALTGLGLAATVRDGDRSARAAKDGAFRLYGSCPGGSLQVSAPGFVKTTVDVGPDRTVAAVLGTPTTVRETFSNVRNWFAGAGGALGSSADGWNAFVAGGAYHVRVTKRNWNAGATSADFDPATRFRTVPRSTVLPADVRFTVEARKVTGADASTAAGVACDTEAAGGLSYEFVVSNDGYYRLDRRLEPRKYTELVPWRKSSHIRAGTRNNRLTVECSGGPPVRVRLVVNGHTLIARKDTPRLKGFQSIYLFAAAYATAPIEVAFDDVVFTRRQ